MDRMSYTLTALLLLASLVLCADWPCFRGDAARTGSSAERVFAPASAPLWTLRLPGAVVSSPSVAGGVVYVGCRDSCLYALSADSGKILWTRKTGGWVDASPLVAGDSIYAGSRDGTMRILDRATGDSVAVLEAGLQMSSPLATGNGIILAGLGPPMNGVAAWYPNLFNEQWTQGFGAICYSSPASKDFTAVIGDNAGNWRGLDIKDKKVLWTIGTSGCAYLSTALLEGQKAYFTPGNTDPETYCVNVQTGEIFWRSNTIAMAKAGRTPVPTPAAARRLIMAKSAPLSKAGRNADFLFFGDVKVSSPCLGERYVYTIQKELGWPKPRFTLIALDKRTGVEAWWFQEQRESERQGYCSSPVYANNRLYFGWGEGKIYCLDAATGKKQWEDSLNGNLLSSPAVSDGKIFFASYAGEVRAYSLVDSTPGTTFMEATYCFPNPAKKARTQIQYLPDRPGNVEARVFDAAERMVKYFRKANAPGKVKGYFDWDLSGAANGVYFAIVKITYTDGKTDVKNIKIAVIKGGR